MPQTMPAFTTNGSQHGRARKHPLCAKRIKGRGPLHSERRDLSKYRCRRATFAQGFFRWYNEEHYHSGLALLTPAMVHYQQTGPILQQRQQVLDVAYQLHPERFVRQAPKQAAVPTEVWINQPCPASAGNGESVPSLK